MKPIIGILAEVDDEKNNRLAGAYAAAIEESGGVPILLPYVEKIDTLEGLIEICDGILFSGGADVDPARYGEEKSAACGNVQLLRDEHEIRVFERVIKTNKPILAICRGAQLVNVALGGSLYQDIPTELETEILHRQTEDRNLPSHSVSVAENTPLFDMTREVRVAANSFHHQAIKRLGDGLRVMATADDGIIEAVYLEGDRYLYAYQWHPERLCNIDKNNRLIFDNFIAECTNER